MSEQKVYTDYEMNGELDYLIVEDKDGDKATQLFIGQEIIKLAKLLPNDQELGAAVRRLVDVLPKTNTDEA